jgi:hypothetical protein
MTGEGDGEGEEGEEIAELDGGDDDDDDSERRRRGCGEEGAGRRRGGDASVLSLGFWDGVAA